MEVRGKTPDQGLRPVPLKRVAVEDEFWSPRLATNRERTIPAIYRQLKETGRIDAYSPGGRPSQEKRATPHFFWDSDVAKWIEAAAYSLATHPDRTLEALVDDVVSRLAAAQQPDGYLNVYFTSVAPHKRWTNLGMWHELYCAGHLIEAGVALYEATGKRSLLDVVRRFADHIDSVFGPGKRDGCCGHPEIELALVRLYRATGERRYLRLSEFFIDRRGRQPSFFAAELERLSPEDAALNRQFFVRDGRLDTSYCQDHAPVRQQTTAVGHAVRAMYLYAGMVDVAVETGDAELLAAARRLWQSVCGRRMHVTGGIGSRREIEGFGGDYDLPNETAYAETCASAGLILWNHRLSCADPGGRYVDVLERALYNGLLAGVSLDGERFFYENPLASLGDHTREEWYEVACCPPNLSRLLASLGQLVYAEGPEDAFVHLYVGGTGELNTGGGKVWLRQHTRYPWDGRVRLEVSPERPATFTLHLRVPGWCPSWTVQVNKEPMEAAQAAGGYVSVHREWRPGDEVRLELAMPVQRVWAHPRVREAAGQVALQRGPLVYCVEEADNGPALHRIVLPAGGRIESRFDERLLGGIVKLVAQAFVTDEAGWEEELYRARPPRLVPSSVTAVPYFAWGNRSAGEMRVWLRSELPAAGAGVQER